MLPSVQMEQLEAWDQIEALEEEVVRLNRDHELIGEELHRLMRKPVEEKARQVVCTLQSTWIEHRLKAIAVQYIWYGHKIPGWRYSYESRARTLLGRYKE